ncbi:hypothetical protein CLV30_10484 [Haloactinopolyspora alba]|uniref:Uncharacterized protein n=2 Tax=Haloactinopolyspora alba TaxID=648780 RepID=A0A2P8E700_9ACTN|nr:hypothetical protein CLV30_10484 [Haloactinopolyspora alba]
MVLAVACLAPFGSATAAVAGTSAATDDAGSTADGAANPPSRVVFVGVAGLAWPDITEQDMPNLHRMAGSDAAGSLTVRTVSSHTCVVDGWLTVGAGSRASDVSDTNGDEREDRFCRQPPEPAPTDDGGVAVPGWTALRQQQQDNSYNARIGLLGDRLGEIGVCATAVGPGAAMALADSAGRVASYHPSPGGIDRAIMTECPVTVVDLGGLPPPAPSGAEEAEQRAAEQTRQQVAAGVDDIVGQIVDSLPDDTALLVTGLSDSAATSVPSPEEPSPIPPAGLRVALASGPQIEGGSFGSTWLTSSSTHWQGLVQLTDVAPTLLGYAGADEPSRGFDGRYWRSSSAHPSSAAATISELVGVDRAAEIYRVQSGPFFQILGIGHLAVVAVALLVLWRRRGASRSGTFRVIQVVALVAAAAPVASYLANLSGWWRYEQLNVVLWSSIAMATLVLTVLALAGPWRRRVYGPPGVVAGVTATVLAIDVASGSSLQQSSLLGLSPLVAGRFYGFGNIPFAIFVVASLVAAAALGQWLLDRGHTRRFAATGVAVVGLVAVVIDGAPQAGADVGGILAAIPGFAVLVLGTLGARVTVVRVALAGVGATVLFFVLAWVDWLRPPGARTHFGGFFADVLSGDALTVILRKAEASVGTVERWPIYGLLVPIGYVIIIWLTRSTDVPATSEAVRRWPLFRYAVWSALLSGAAGFAANDSGVIIPALLLTAGIPLGVSTVAAAHRQAGPAETGSELVERAGGSAPT